MKKNTFESIIQNFLDSDSSGISNYIEFNFRKKFYKDYEVFLDDFLYNLGISFNCVPDFKSNHYIPYLKFSKHNIFDEPSGFVDLLKEPKSLHECKIVLAEYLVRKFAAISILKIYTWDN